MPISPPPNTSEQCTAKDWNQPPPAPAGQTCQQTDFQRSGNKATWKLTCSGQMDMTGEGEITLDTPESYTGRIDFVAEGGTKMKVNLSGKKIGECDNPAS